MSMTLVPVCWQTTVTAENKNRILQNRILRLRRGAQATFYRSAAVRSSRSVFIVWKRSFLYDKKKTPAHAEVFFPVLLITEFLRSAHSVVSI